MATALGITPDKLTGAVAYLVAAGGALAEGRPAVAAQLIDRARAGWSVPAWLDRQLSLAESRACAAAGDIQAALISAGRAGTSPEAAWPALTRPPEMARPRTAPSPRCSRPAPRYLTRCVCRRCSVSLALVSNLARCGPASSPAPRWVRVSWSWPVRAAEPRRTASLRAAAA